MEAPVPRAPSIFEYQTILALRSPSSRSEAVPLSVTPELSEITAPLAGLRMETLGGVLGLVTVMVTEALAVKPAASVAEAVIVCVPAARLAVKLAPVPI